jgi:hypothetical protein
MKSTIDTIFPGTQVLLVQVEEAAFSCNTETKDEHKKMNHLCKVDIT